MAEEHGKALVLIPCCKSKSTIQGEGFVEPLPGIKCEREKMAKLLGASPTLTSRKDNKEGILSASAPLTRALELYTGTFYNAADLALRDIATGRHPSIHVLIVSAFYGLVRPGEGVHKYELQMGDTLQDGTKVYRFWQKNGLPRILTEYAERNGITHVWSLLPDSLPWYPYHRLFGEAW